MAHSQSKTFWSFLILVDVLLLVAFGWALVDRVITLFQEPIANVEAAHLPKARQPRKVDTALETPAGPPAPAELPAPVVEPPKLEAKAEPKVEPKVEPKPAVHKAEPARKAEPVQKAEPAHKSDPNKAKKVVFTFHNRSAKKVYIEGTFTKWKSAPMTKNKAGEWTYTSYLLPGNSYPYRFIVDGKILADPDNPNQKWGKSLMPVK